MRRLAPQLLVLAGCWPYDFDQLLAECGDGGLSCQLDAGLPDAGAKDAGATDAGGADAGGTDAGPLDAGERDAGVTDAGSFDAGRADAGDGDAGAADAGGVDAGLDAGVDPCATALFCEHFDDADGGYRARWGMEQTGAWGASIDTQSAAMGTGALRVDLGDAGETQYKLVHPFDGGTAWMRFFYRVSALPIDDLYLAGVRLSAHTDSNAAVGVSQGSGSASTEAFIKSGWMGGTSHYVGLNAAAGWHCLEARLAFATVSVGELYFDGASLGTIQLASGTVPTADEVTLGPYLYVTGADGGLGVGTPMTVWLDEFVLSRSRPGCAR